MSGLKWWVDSRFSTPVKMHLAPFEISAFSGPLTALYLPACLPSGECLLNQSKPAPVWRLLCVSIIYLSTVVHFRGLLFCACDWLTPVEHAAQSQLCVLHSLVLTVAYYVHMYTY